jgi:hypothetical protein
MIYLLLVSLHRACSTAEVRDNTVAGMSSNGVQMIDKGLEHCRR